MYLKEQFEAQKMVTRPRKRSPKEAFFISVRRKKRPPTKSDGFRSDALLRSLSLLFPLSSPFAPSLLVVLLFRRSDTLGI